ncbi:MAG TPA: hypothetical protein VFG56_00145 [Candidatus Saccharimonadales bacterium]|nr:hypothetical protein [Candidatus Saccharimonadales bacterium]
MSNKTTTTSSKQLTAQLKAAGQPIAKHHVVIVVVLFLGFLTYAVFTVSQILLSNDQSMDTKAQEQAITTNFDQKTIEQIQQLKSRQQSTDLSLPEGHINPFD